MTTHNNQTVGAFLNEAQRRLKENGGLTAAVDCDAEIVRLFHTDATGTRQCLASAPLPEGRAGEDAANDLLDGVADQVDPAALEFARAIYFPILFH